MPFIWDLKAPSINTSIAYHKMKLFCRQMGKGQPLIILHGLFGMSDNWQSLAKQFADFFEVHLLDLRNHGRSPHSTNFSHFHMAEDLLTYIDQHQLSNAIILGHSLGGKVAMKFAVQHSSKIDKLVVVDISPRHYPVHHDTIIQGLESLDFTSIVTRRQADEELAKYVHQADVRQFLLKSIYWKDKKKLALRFNLSSISENISNVGESLDQEATFDKPTLFLKGQNSDYITDDDEELIFEHFPNAKIEIISDCGHWLHAEKPKQFFEIVCRFCI